MWPMTYWMKIADLDIKCGYQMCVLTPYSNGYHYYCFPLGSVAIKNTASFLSSAYHVKRGGNLEVEQKKVATRVFLRHISSRISFKHSNCIMKRGASTCDGGDTGWQLPLHHSASKSNNLTLDISDSIVVFPQMFLLLTFHMVSKQHFKKPEISISLQNVLQVFGTQKISIIYNTWIVLLDV